MLRHNQFSQIHNQLVFPVKTADVCSRTKVLTDSQLEAVRKGSEERLTLVQGPPGTGKSYVGLAIVRQLLATSPPGDIIHIVCATNQALDHFLSGIAEFAPNQQDIVRLGGQSKDPSLDRFNIRRLYQPQNARVVASLIDAKQSIDSEIWLNLPQRRRLNELQQIGDAIAIRRASCRVLGMTSTMAAKCQTLLSYLRPRTVLVEEAATMLEPHVMIALTNSVERLVLIGE